MLHIYIYIYIYDISRLRVNTAKNGSKTAFKIRPTKLLASLNYHLNEAYVKRGEVGKNTRTRVLLITELCVCVHVCVRAQHTLS